MSDMAETETNRQPDAPREGGSRLWKWTKRVLVGVVGSVVVVLLAGVIYQFVATKSRCYANLDSQTRMRGLASSPPLGSAEPSQNPPQSGLS
jgi:hypothetical protein